jgi:hypothetical protein
MISDNFIGNTLRANIQFDKSQLVSSIDEWKYILKYKCSAKAGESILVGMQALNQIYFAIIFAAAELSLKIVIIDYARIDNFVDTEFYDPKTKILSPIDIFLHDSLDITSKDASGKFKFFAGCSKRTYFIYGDIDMTIDNMEDFEIAKNIFPKPSDILMRCTSSGTTGTPKIIEHSHEFLYKISIRNSTRFFGRCLHTRNLNHGSSLAVYLLPAFASPAVSENLFLAAPLDSSMKSQEMVYFVATLEKFSDTLEYIIFPYPNMIDDFIDASKERNVVWPKLNVQTLSYIQDSAKLGITKGIFKSITSIFGSNETSGPIFLAHIEKSTIGRNADWFKKVDDFYGLRTDMKNMLHVTMPMYNTEIVTNDLFKKVGKFYQHAGRSDLAKINGKIFDLELINALNSRNPHAHLVIDSVKNSIYLAFWARKDEKLESEYLNFFINKFDGMKINKTAILDKSSFQSGVKIDNELLREHFRNYV